jgi:hypothetical protein
MGLHLALAAGGSSQLGGTMRASSWIAVLCAAETCAHAQGAAPATDPIVAHFREYRAALERNDLAAAEAAAVAALEQSEAAQGTRTAVLALNLANLRLDRDQPASALEPARRAHALATTAANTGVDPLLASLTLGRAELASGDAAGAQRLQAAITEAEQRGGLAAETYPAATALGTWAFGASLYDIAREGWAAASRLADGATADPTFARARALTGVGAAIVLEGIDRSLPIGSRAPRFATEKATAADDAFTQAQRLLYPSAYPDDATKITAGQIAYAQAMAWQGALRAKLATQDLELRMPQRDPELDASPAPPGDRRPACDVRTIAEPKPEYPRQVLTRYGVGAVVLLMNLDATGNILSRYVVAAVPSGPLAEAVGAVADRWRVELTKASTPDCRMPRARYVQVQFVIE